MRDDLISRAAAVDALDHLDYTPGEWNVKGLTMCKDAIKALPPVDAVPVVHGRWEIVDDWDGDEHYKCNVCGAEFVLIEGDPDDNDYLYCPHCGARMDGEGNGNETD